MTTTTDLQIQSLQRRVERLEQTIKELNIELEGLRDDYKFLLERVENYQRLVNS